MIVENEALRAEWAKVSPTHLQQIKRRIEERGEAFSVISESLPIDHADKSKILRLVSQGQNIAIALGAGVFLVVLATFI